MHNTLCFQRINCQLACFSQQQPNWKSSNHKWLVYVALSLEGTYDTVVKNKFVVKLDSSHYLFKTEFNFRKVFMITMFDCDGSVWVGVPK